MKFTVSFTVTGKVCLLRTATQLVKLGIVVKIAISIYCNI